MEDQEYADYQQACLNEYIAEKAKYDKKRQGKRAKPMGVFDPFVPPTRDQFLKWRKDELEKKAAKQEEKEKAAMKQQEEAAELMKNAREANTVQRAAERQKRNRGGEEENGGGGEEENLYDTLVI